MLFDRVLFFFNLTGQKPHIAPQEKEQTKNINLHKQVSG
jgi:hypothetical protein